mmetsp:Transcript_126739/g.405825  ORF Transcript_126739/g.405825 Transcript_126739/m.405825 type:complete len:207 (-) Transcript_126739:44-664(-)
MMQAVAIRRLGVLSRAVLGSPCLRQWSFCAAADAAAPGAGAGGGTRAALRPWLACASASFSSSACSSSSSSGGGDEEVRRARAVAAPAEPDTAPATIFDKILSREIPAKVVHEDEKCLAFRDVSPQAPVHILVIPKERDGLTQLSKARDDQAALLGHLLLTAGRLGAAQCPGGFRLVVNDGPDGCQSVYHLHVHVIGGRPLGWPPG